MSFASLIPLGISLGASFLSQATSKKGGVTDQFGIPTVSPAVSRATSFTGSALEDLFSTAEADAPQLSEFELLSLSGLEDVARGLVSGKGDISKTLEQALSSVQGLLDRGPTDINDFFTNTIADPLINLFDERILPGIRTRFAPQIFGGEARRAEEFAIEDLFKTLTAARSNVAFQAREADTDTLLNAVQLIPGLASVPVGLLQQLLGSAGLEREQRSGELGNRSRIIDQLVGLISGGRGSVENIKTIMEPSDSIFSSALSGIGAGAAGSIDFAKLSKSIASIF